MQLPMDDNNICPYCFRVWPNLRSLSSHIRLSHYDSYHNPTSHAPHNASISGSNPQKPNHHSRIEEVRHAGDIEEIDFPRSDCTSPANTNSISTQLNLSRENGLDKQSLSQRKRKSPPQSSEPSNQSPAFLDSSSDSDNINNIDTDDIYLGIPYECNIQAATVIPLHLQSMARIYKTADQAGCPKYLVDEIFDVIRDEHNRGCLDICDPNITKRESFFKQAAEALRHVSIKEVPVTLESQETVTVLTLDFHSKLQAHLLSDAFSSIEHLDLPDQNQPWSSMPKESDLDYSSFTHSQWYLKTCQAHASQLTDGSHLMHPLTLYIDKTGVDKQQKYSLEPLVATSSILSAKAKRKSSNWFVIGFIPNLEDVARTDSSAGVRDYHRCLSALLKPLAEMQRCPPKMTARRGTQLNLVKLILPVSTVMGDNLSSNKLCGRVHNNGPSSPRMSRRCLTTYSDCDNVPHPCHLIDPQLVIELSHAAIGCLQKQPGTMNIGHERCKSFLDSLPSPDQKGSAQILLKKREKLAKDILHSVLCAHPIANAFDSIDMGANSSIHTATVADIMHTVEQGIIKEMLQCIIGVMTPSQKLNLDKVVSQMFSSRGDNRSGERSSYPRVSFKSGFSSLTMLTADEIVLLYCLSSLPCSASFKAKKFVHSLTWFLLHTIQ